MGEADDFSDWIPLPLPCGCLGYCECIESHGSAPNMSRALRELARLVIEAETAASHTNRVKAFAAAVDLAKKVESK